MISRYKIEEKINQGGAGVILKAWDTRHHRPVAIKRFLPGGHGSEEGVDKDFLREAAVLSSMRHPGIVSLYDMDRHAEHGPEVIMEYLNGQDLERAVAGAALTVPDFLQVAEQTLAALNHAHSLDLLHRDIKPSNIQVTWLPDGSFVAKLVDFGLARFSPAPSRQTVRVDGTVLGSVHYMSPEQLRRETLDPRTDLYSLGCVLYFVLTMRRPFEGASAQDVIQGHLHGVAKPLDGYRPDLPQGLGDWVAWLMSRNPADRPSSAKAALRALRRAASPAVSVPPCGTAARLSG